MQTKNTSNPQTREVSMQRCLVKANLSLKGEVNSQLHILYRDSIIKKLSTNIDNYKKTDIIQPEADVILDEDKVILVGNVEIIVKNVGDVAKNGDKP